MPDKPEENSPAMSRKEFIALPMVERRRLLRESVNILLSNLYLSAESDIEKILTRQRRAIAARLLAISKENTDLKSYQDAVMELQKELEET
jgi:hypothetical protein